MNDSERIKQIADDVAALRSAFAASMMAFAAALGVQVGPPAARSGGGDRPAEGAVATDRDLDGQYGDPTVRKDPSEKYWPGPSFVGVPLSQCSPEFLDSFAKYKDACAYANEQEGKPDKAKYIAYDRRDAARARGWAARMRSAQWRTKPRPGAKQPPPTDEDYEDDYSGDDAPF